MTADAPLFGEAVGIDDEFSEEAEGFTVKPRTVRDSFTISPAALHASYRWQVVSLHGEVVKQGQANGPARVGMDDTPEGLYIVNIKGKKNETSQKILRKADY